MQPIHWIALFGISIAVVLFFGATTEKRLRGDVALVIALASFVLVMLYLLAE